MKRILSWFLVALLLALSGGLDGALSMASARGFEKSQYGRSAPSQHKYSYRAGDPVNASDPSGLESLRYGPGATTRAPDADMRRLPGNVAMAGKVVGASALLLAIKNPYAAANWYLTNPVGVASTAGGAAYGFFTGDASGPIGGVAALSATMTATEIERQRLQLKFGCKETDWGYAGLFHHGPSGLDLATFRAYDSAQGRWISRDPLGESAGLNLYAYCGNNPINFTDASGLRPIFPGGPNVLTSAIEAATSVIANQHPGWSTQVGLNNPDFWAHQESEGVAIIGGTTGQNTGDDVSYIHVARLSRIQDSDFRFFEYMQVVAHEIWHQNNPTPSDRPFGDPMVERAADNFGFQVVEAYVNKSCDDRLKKKFKLYRQRHKEITRKWGDDWLWYQIQQSSSPEPKL